MPRQLDFIYVGAPKAGSSWIFETLSEHPEVSLFASKSSGFFETETPGPLAQYQAQLDRIEAGGKTGEIAHDAFLYANTAARLREAFPDVRILACLREPGEFAGSTIKWWMTHTDRFGKDVDSMAAHPHFRKLMDYQGRMQPFFDAFPAEQIKVLFFDDLARNPHEFFAGICRHIGVDPDFEPAGLDHVVNASRPPRFQPLTHAIYKMGGVGRSLGLGRVVERTKRLGTLDAMLYAGQPQQTPREILALQRREREMACDGLAALESLIGQSLPAHWREA